MPTRLAPADLRSYRWFGPNDLRSFGHRSRARQMGLGPEDWEGKPVIAILNTWSEINPCHLHFKVLAENVKKGVLQAGGMPIEIPVLSLSENFMKPTTMLYRNLLAMETEEVLRCHPADGAVLLGACDKTTPALIMGALSAGAALHLRARRADAARQLARPDARLGVGCVEVLGGKARRAISPRRNGAKWRRASPARTGIA